MSRTLPLSNFSSQSHLIGQSVFNQINWVLPGMIKSHLNSNSPDIVYKDTFSIEEMKRELVNEVEEKLKMLDNSVSTTKAKVDSHLASIVEAKDALDEATKTCADTESRLKAELLEINNLKETLSALIQRNLEDSSSSPNVERLASVERICDQLIVSQDKQEQYTRRETLNFLKILLNIDPRTGKEDTTQMIVDFCRRHLNIHINKYDISVSHRMPIAADKKKLGKNYVAPIDCRFVNRSVAMMVMKRRSMLKNVKNSRNQNYDVEENLTLPRRLLKDRVEKELPSYRFKWVKNGNIFVRKDSSSEPIKLFTDKMLDELIHQENTHRTNRKVTKRPARTFHNRHPARFNDNNAPQFSRRSQSIDFPRLPQHQINYDYDWYENDYIPDYIPLSTVSSNSASNHSRARAVNNYSSYSC